QPLDDAARTECSKIIDHLHLEGFRALAVASRQAPAGEYHPKDERELTLVGFLSFSNPPLEDAARALLQLQRDGVEVKILTGDNELVARHICSSVGLDLKKIILGSELDQ